MIQRVCYWPHCITILSRTNPGPYCWCHTPEHPVMPFIKADHRVMSDGFLGNITGTYAITPEERAHYQRGGDA